MIPTYQTRFGNEHSPPEERGDCYKACVASILEIPLDAVPDYQEMPCGTGENYQAWQEAWYEWFAKRGLFLATIPSEHPPPGYSIGHLKLPPNDTWHSVVCKDGEVVHDPMGPRRRYDPEDVELYEVFCLSDPSKLREGVDVPV